MSEKIISQKIEIYIRKNISQIVGKYIRKVYIRKNYIRNRWKIISEKIISEKLGNYIRKQMAPPSDAPGKCKKSHKKASQTACRRPVKDIVTERIQIYAKDGRIDLDQPVQVRGKFSSSSCYPYDQGCGCRELMLMSGAR